MVKHLYHNPKRKFPYQLGNGSLLSQLSKKKSFLILEKMILLMEVKVLL